MKNKIKLIKNEIHKILVGQEDLIDSLLIGLLSNGHILVEGVPGLAKTTAVNALSQSLGLEFKRVQFTPDLLPADITGTEIYNQKEGNFKVKKGPAFTNLLLADEINRAPAKVQSALLEVMQEKQITIADTTFKLDKPFLVLATQNPIEQEGAYKLPEAQLDRFMMNVLVGYNTKDEEKEVIKRVANNTFGVVEKILTKEELLLLIEEVKEVHVDDGIVDYIMEIIDATRNPENYDLSDIKKYIEYGVSPRASIDLYKAAKASAFIKGNDYVTPVDIANVLEKVLRHRIILTYSAEADGITKSEIINKIVQKIQIP